MKLLYITNGINGSGGLERVLSIKASYLADKMDYEVHILVLNEAHQNLFYRFSEKVQFHAIAVLGNPIQYFVQYRKGIKKQLQDIQPHIISVCDDGLKGMLFPVIFGKKIPVIYERHVSKQIENKKGKHSFSETIRRNIKLSLMNFGAKRFHKFVVLTKGNQKEWVGKNVVVIPNPLPFFPEEQAVLLNKKVLVVGKQSYQKGYDRLIDIWSVVSRNHPEWQLQVYGKKDVSFGFEDMLVKKGLSDTLSFYPPTKTIETKYEESSIYLMTSRFEGFGMVLIEAMAYGVPCISFDCPHGPADIINDGQDGVLVPNGDIQAFTKALSTLMVDKDQRKQMGTQARKNVERYLPERVLPMWDVLFRELVE